MKIYERNITRQLRLLRGLLLIMVWAGIFIFYRYHFRDALVVEVFFFLCCAFIPVRLVRIDYSILEVGEYLVFGLFPRTTRFEKTGPIFIHSFEIELSNPDTADNNAVTSWSSVNIKKTVLRQIDGNGKTNIARIRLSEEELSIIRTYFNIQPEEQS